MSLASLACQTRQIALFTQTAHWFTQGATFKQDHVLLGEIYDSLAELLDSFAERAIGTGLEDVSELSPATQAECIEQAPECNFKNPMESMVCLLRLLTGLLEAIDTESDTASLGTQDLLSAAASDVEKLVYFLTQRLKTA